MTPTTRPLCVLHNTSQNIPLNHFQDLIKDQGYNYWILGAPQPPTVAPNPELFERARYVLVMPTEQDRHDAARMAAEKKEQASGSSTGCTQKQMAERRSNEQAAKEEVSRLQHMLEEANTSMKKLQEELTAERDRTNALETQMKGLHDQLEDKKLESGFSGNRSQ